MREKDNFKRLLFVFLAGAALSSCVESDFDLGKDIDMTMGLGSDKLVLKLGNTEKIYLRDVLKIDDSEMLDTLTEGQTNKGLYYLIKDGSADAKVEVNEIPPFQIMDVNVLPSTPLVPAPGSDIVIPKGDLEPVDVDAINKMDVDIAGIPSEVKRIRKIIPNPVNLRMTLSIDQPAGTAFVIRAVKGLKITFPDFVNSSAFLPGTHTLKVNDLTNQNVTSISIPAVSLDYFLLGGDPFGELVKNGEIVLRDDVEMEGTFTLGASRDFTLKGNESATVHLKVEVGDIHVNTISGIVDPEINPLVDPISISNDLPDFLKDESVVLEMSNPTLKFDVQGKEHPDQPDQELPIPLLFSAQVKSMDGANTIAEVGLPVSGFVDIPAAQNSVFYFYQDQNTGPFDPDLVSPSAGKYLVPTLSNLIRKLPETINVDLSDGKVKADQSKLHTIELNRNYNIPLNYQVLVPFQFNRGLKIVYTDSVSDMHKDLKDYEAEGMTVTATAVNRIPLDLNLKLIPMGVSGEDLSELIEVGQVVIKAANGPAESAAVETPVSITITLKKPAALKLLNKLEFRVEANSISSNQLTSQQYLILNEVRLKLNGQVTADFN